MGKPRLSTLRNRVESYRDVARRRHPMGAAAANLSFRGLESIGERATGSRTGRTSLLALVAVVAFAAPAVAVSCKAGPLSFLAKIHGLITMSAGTIIISMVIIAGVLKMIPMRGTNSWGNALVGSVLVGILFLVVAPALIDLADKTTPIKMNVQCTGDGGGG